MDTRKFALAAFVLGLGALSATPAYAQLDRRCSTAVDNEVFGRYPEAERVAATAMRAHPLSDFETTYSGAGHFEDVNGVRTLFLFECISNARTGRAYGVTIRNAPGRRSATASNLPLVRAAGSASGDAMLGGAVVNSTPRRSLPAPGSVSASNAATLNVPAAADEAEETAVADAGEAEMAPSLAQRLESGSRRVVETSMAAPEGASDEAECMEGATLACAPESAPPPVEALDGAELPMLASATPDLTSSRPVSDTALERIAPGLPEGQAAVIRYAAQATAAASVCSNVELNNDAVVGTVTTVVQAMSVGLTRQEVARRRDAALVAYGMLTGILLQQAEADLATFCSDATGYADAARSWSFIRVAEGS